MNETAADTRLARGLEALNRVDPAAAANIFGWLEDVFPELARITIEFGYGDVMSRQGLDMCTRELVNIAMLGAMGTAPHQLEMHVRGALNTGATKAQILEVVLQIAAFAGFPAAYNAVGVVKNVFSSTSSTTVPPDSAERANGDGNDQSCGIKQDGTR